MAAVASESVPTIDPPMVPPPDLDTIRIPSVTSGKVISNALLAALGFVIIVPLVWIVFASLDSQASYSIELPHLTLANFKAAFSSQDAESLWVSLEMSLIATVVATVSGVLAAYAFSRRHIPFKGPLLLGTLFLSGVPITVLIVPIYQLFSAHNWLTLVPASIFIGVTSLPFEIWIIKNFMDAVPGDLEEAAKIERASTWQILTRIVIPLSLPGIGAAGIFGFVNAWGQFLIPLVLVSNQTNPPASIQIYSFLSGTQTHYGDIAAFSLVYSLPVVILYLIVGRLFSGGFTLGGAVKG